MATFISKEQAKNISSLKRYEGRQCLASSLGWPRFDEEDDPQHSIHLDYLYDNLIFMASKGFSWNAVVLLFDVAKITLQESMGKSLPETIKIYNDLIKEVESKINTATLEQFTDFFFSTFMSHYKLYQYVFTTNRELMQIDLTLPVSIPTNPVPFTEAKEVDIYEYEQKYNKIEAEEQQKQQERAVINELKMREDCENLQKTLKNVDNISPPLDREKIKQIIHDVASSHLTSTSNALQQNISSTMEDLGYMLEKTALERPTALGAPPRYKPKTPMTAAGAKKPPATSREKSGSKSRLSTKGSKRG